MAVPNTYLLGAPCDKDPFGRAIQSSDIVKGLKEINPRITSWEQHTPGLWYPGKKRGISSLWLGQPGATWSKADKTVGGIKISAFNYGPIPEFTQIDPNGEIISKGWRAIFAKVMLMKAASAQALEQKFHVRLEVGEEDTVYCRLCRREGRYEKSENSSGLCNIHEAVRKQVEQTKARKAQVKDFLRRTG